LLFQQTELFWNNKSSLLDYIICFLQTAVYKDYFMIFHSVKKFLSCMAPMAACAILLLSGGCASVPERHPLPLDLSNQATIPDIPKLRFWGNEWPKFASERFETFTVAEFQEHYSGIYGQPHNYLAISGGGANGAFGAGLLAGWAASGTRPEFTMVTGISTGALTAPFAFLGAEYDDTLKELYTTKTTKDIVEKRGILTAAFSDSIADTAPLSRLIAHYITPDIVESIAKEHQRGRRLFIGTLNLDAARSVIWNIGAIAVSDYPEKNALIHKLMLASASIPVAFPPVVIDVSVNGKTYDEMHVDGGTGSQVFVYPAAADWRFITEKLKVKGKPQIYVLRNSFLDPDYHNVERVVLPIASRSIDSLIRTQGIGDLYQIFSLCKRDGNDFNLAYIPSDFTEKPTEAFDKAYMSKLYQLGHDLGQAGYDWRNEPPGF